MGMVRPAYVMVVQESDNSNFVGAPVDSLARQRVDGEVGS